MIYFDSAASTKVDEDVIRDITWCLEEVYGNPSSIHTEGFKAKQLLAYSREKIAKFIGANPKEIIFTSSGSESNNLAIKGFMEANNLFNCIVTTEIEHPSVYNTCKYLSNKYRVEYAPVDSHGKVDIDKFKELMSELNKRKFCFVSIMLANNEIGTIQPIKEIAEVVHKYDGVLHVDATQAIGHIPVNVVELGCDLLTFSGHKLNCPKGIAVLYKRKGIHISPIIHGGHQERNQRAGTENLPYIYALGNKVDRIVLTQNERIIRNYLTASLPENVIINGGTNENDSLPNILSLTFKDVNAEILIILLNEKGICVSAGSACSSGIKDPSRILKAIGLSDKDAFSTIRVSIDRGATFDECDEFIKVLKGCLKEIRVLGGE